MSEINRRTNPTGYINRRIALRRMQFRAREAKMLAKAFRDITDGDGDNRTAARLLNKLMELSVYEQEIDARIADGDLNGAEAAVNKYLPVDDGKRGK